MIIASVQDTIGVLFYANIAILLVLIIAYFYVDLTNPAGYTQDVVASMRAINAREAKLQPIWGLIIFFACTFFVLFMIYFPNADAGKAIADIALNKR